MRSYAGHHRWGDALPQNAPMPLEYGAGDEVFSIGLFDGHSGVGRTRPVVRFGHVALVPGLGERVLAEIWPAPHALVEIDAFLIEIASWGGQSGSPIFLRPVVVDKRAKNRPIERNYLIGMIQGFYPGEQDVKINGMDATLSPLNMGIGIAIPAKDIMELLMRKDLKEKREQALEKLRLNPKVRPSVASLKRNEPNITKDGFEDALKLASRKTSEPESEGKVKREK